jgi:hypothetical protein
MGIGCTVRDAGDGQHCKAGKARVRLRALQRHRF